MPHEVLACSEMRKRYPLFKLADHEIGVYEEHAGVLQAELCVESFIALARKHGADLRFEEPMLEWSAVGAGEGGGTEVPGGLLKGVCVRSARGTYFARKLVLAVGAWAPALYGSLMPQMRMYIERRVLFWFEAEQAAAAEFQVSDLTLVQCPLWN